MLGRRGDASPPLFFSFSTKLPNFLFPMFTPARAVKLPNERIALCDNNDYTEIFGVVVSLSSVINNDFEGFLDMLSEEATGSQSLQDISYSLIGVSDGDLIFKVTGVITDIDTDPV